MQVVRRGWLGRRQQVPRRARVRGAEYRQRHGRVPPCRQRAGVSFGCERQRPVATGPEPVGGRHGDRDQAEPERDAAKEAAQRLRLWIEIDDRDLRDPDCDRTCGDRSHPQHRQSCAQRHDGNERHGETRTEASIPAWPRIHLGELGCVPVGEESDDAAHREPQEQHDCGDHEQASKSRLVVILGKKVGEGGPAQYDEAEHPAERPAPHGERAAGTPATPRQPGHVDHVWSARHHGAAPQSQPGEEAAPRRRVTQDRGAPEGEEGRNRDARSDGQHPRGR